MARNEFVKARVSPEEKEIYQQLCEQAGCTEAELIRSVLIHREISLDDLDDEMQVLGRKKKALHKQQENYRRAQASRETDESGEPISEKRSIPFQVMLTAPEKKAIEQRAEALGISVSELVRRSTIYGKIESFNFDIAEVEKLHHELFVHVVLYHFCTVVQVSKALLNKNKKRSRSTARIHRRAGDECDCAGCVCNRGVAVIAYGGCSFLHI